MKKVVCPKCGKASTISEWNKKTNRFYSPFYPVENPDEMQIDVISESDFDEYGTCTTKGDVNSTNVTMYVCPKCNAETYSYRLKLVDVVEKDDTSSCLVCKKFGIGRGDMSNG